MGDNGSLTRAQHAVLFWAFLQADCEHCCPEFCKEVQSLAKDLNDNEATLYGLDCGDLESDGDLETDGHMSSALTIALQGIEPSVDVHEPAIIQVAAEIREISAQLEQNIVTRATQNLTRNISGSSTEHWKEYLHLEVQNILARGVGLDNLQEERVIAALTFTLVRGVCLQAPRLLRSLFDTALQYLSPEGSR